MSSFVGRVNVCVSHRTLLELKGRICVNYLTKGLEDGM